MRRYSQPNRNSRLIPVFLEISTSKRKCFNPFPNQNEISPAAMPGFFYRQYASSDLFAAVVIISIDRRGQNQSQQINFAVA
jgi:hypothetical protein